MSEYLSLNARLRTTDGKIYPILHSVICAQLIIAGMFILVLNTIFLYSSFSYWIMLLKNGEHPAQWKEEQITHDRVQAER